MQKPYVDPACTMDVARTKGRRCDLNEPRVVKHLERQIRFFSSVKPAAADTLAMDSHSEVHSWYLLTTCNCTYNPLMPLKCPNMGYKYSYQYSYNWLRSTMNLKARDEQTFPFVRKFPANPRHQSQAVRAAGGGGGIQAGPLPYRRCSQP